MEKHARYVIDELYTQQEHEKHILKINVGDTVTHSQFIFLCETLRETCNFYLDCNFLLVSGVVSFDKDQQ